MAVTGLWIVGRTSRGLWTDPGYAVWSRPRAGAPRGAQAAEPAPLADELDEPDELDADEEPDVDEPLEDDEESEELEEESPLAAGTLEEEPERESVR